MSLVQPFRHALPVNESLFHEALYLTHAGWEIVAPGAPYPQSDAPLFFFEWKDGRTLPEFCLAFLVAGCGEFQTRIHRSRLAAGEAFLFRPGEWHRHRPSPQTGWTLMWIHFNGDEPLRWLRNESFNLRQNIPVIENRKLFQAQFENLLESVHRKPSTNSANFSRQAIGLLSHCLMDTSDGAIRGNKAVRDEVIQSAVEFIWNYSHDVVDVPAVAHEIGIARRTLDRRFKAATGRSVLEEIQFCRVTRAARLLQETDMPVKHIVHRAGFRSDEHLRLAFRRAFGKSPRIYRREIRAGTHFKSQPLPASRGLS
jgi:AraC-like DNA-binding protein